ncbi:MAG TPA: thioredoxin domain-containing protein, partial [Candidatus Paceibacterota bacterium]
MTTHTHPHNNGGSEKKNILTLPVAIVFGSLVIAGSILITRGDTTEAARQPAQAQAASLSGVRAASAQDHIVGSPDAKVVIVEYADFECPYCSMIYTTLKKVVADSNGQVAWVYREFPLDSIHPEARPSAEAAECLAAELGNDAFWKFADAAFEDQKDLGAQLYASTAASLGADQKTFSDCTTSKKYDSV